MSIVDMVTYYGLSNSNYTGPEYMDKVSAYVGSFHILIENEIRNKSEQENKR